jgi:cytochrome P450
MHELTCMTMICCAVQVIKESPVASAVAQEVLRLGNSNLIQQRIAKADTVVSGVQIPAGMNVWLAPRQVCLSTSE